MVSQTNLVNLLLEAPARPEPALQVSRIESDSAERFDHVLESEVNTPAPKASQPFEAKAKPCGSCSETPAASSQKPADAPATQSQRIESHPAPINNNESHIGTADADATAQGPLNPFALPIEQLNATAEDLPALPEAAGQAAFEAIADLVSAQAAGEQGFAAGIDSFKDALTALNIDPETIDLLVDALQNGDAAGLQGILNALRGLLQAASEVTQAIGGETSGVAGASQGRPEQLALALLMRAGLTQEEAQQIIQQVQNGNAPQPLNDNSNAFAKSVADALAPKVVPDAGGNHAGTMQNSGQNGGETGKGASGAPHPLAGVTGERLESISNLVAPDKAGVAPTNPLLDKGAVNPLLNTAKGAPQVQGILADAAPGQAPAAAAEAAARGADFVKPALTETYNGRAAMDKPVTAQIIEKFSLRGMGNQREVHIKLDPPSLGTVRMNVSTHGDSVRATIVAENNIVKSIIENNLAQLKDSITHQGVKIDSFNVLVGGNASHSAEGHRAGLEFLDQLGGSSMFGPAEGEEIVTLHRPVFVYENQSISLFA